VLGAELLARDGKVVLSRVCPEHGSVVESKRVRLPRLMRTYHRDFGIRDEQLAFAARYVPALAVIAAERRRVRIRYGRFDWTVAPRPSR